MIGHDHLDSSSVASPNRENEVIKDDANGVSDWTVLDALVSTALSATLVSLKRGGASGMGFSQHAGVVIFADGTHEATK